MKKRWPLFPGQQRDETEVAVYRKHPVALGKKFGFYIFSLIVLFAIYILLNIYTDWFDDNSSFLYMVVVIFISLYTLFTSLFLFHAWVDYYLDLLIITNERVITIRQDGLFHRAISELRLYRVQDVYSEVKGLFPTIFKYGNIEVQTASGEDRFIFKHLPHPERVASQIMELHEKYVEARGLHERDENLPRTELNNFHDKLKDEIKSV